MNLRIRISKPRNWYAAFYFASAIGFVLLTLAVAVFASPSAEAVARGEKGFVIVVTGFLAVFCFVFAALSWNEKP